MSRQIIVAIVNRGEVLCIHDHDQGVTALPRVDLNGKEEPLSGFARYTQSFFGGRIFSCKKRRVIGADDEPVVVQGISTMLRVLELDADPGADMRFQWCPLSDLSCPSTVSDRIKQGIAELSAVA